MKPGVSRDAQKERKRQLPNEIDGKSDLFAEDKLFAEIYRVALTIEVVSKFRGEDERVRIEILERVAERSFTARVYLERQVHVRDAPTMDRVDRYYSWVDWSDFPDARGNDADAAIRSALSFLRERSKL